MRKIIGYLIISLFLLLNTKAQNLYFPPASNSANWDTVSPASLGWCVTKIDSLYNFLQQENSKAFIVLKNGKIVLEKYFGSFTKDSLWYWASAGKTLTSFLIGKAQEEGFLSINDTSLKYLGAGWTNETAAQESKIKIRHQLTMTSGLDDGVPDNHCTIDTCLNYLADAGNRWAYHNAPYTLLEKVITTATGQAINTYTFSKLKLKTGIGGLWVMSDYDNVFFSTPRNMARFGLLFENRCIWNTDTMMYDTAYIRQMTTTSQSFNLSYGYLWWLNGKASFMAPGTQLVFNGSYAPHAPVDMFAGIGKNGQIVCVSKSKGLVVVRMGDQPTNFGEVPFLFCDQVWEKLNTVMCNGTLVSENNKKNDEILIFPNPAHSIINVGFYKNENFEIQISDLLGNIIISLKNKNNVDISLLNNGIYFLKLTENQHTIIKKIIKQ
ncbi:MAG: serine hydrolase [Bacteroidetes bacterium]|nr:serine hydrolase [Bacteroidota bacterium]